MWFYGCRSDCCCCFEVHGGQHPGEALASQRWREEASSRSRLWPIKGTFLSPGTLQNSDYPVSCSSILYQQIFISWKSSLESFSHMSDHKSQYSWGLQQHLAWILRISSSMLQILYTDDLCAGEQVFFAATGVSDGDLLQGVRYYSGGASTNSIVMRASSGTGIILGSTNYSLELSSPCLPTTRFYDKLSTKAREDG